MVADVGREPPVADEWNARGTQELDGHSRRGAAGQGAAFVVTSAVRKPRGELGPEPHRRRPELIWVGNGAWVACDPRVSENDPNRVLAYMESMDGVVTLLRVKAPNSFECSDCGAREDHCTTSCADRDPTIARIPAPIFDRVAVECMGCGRCARQRPVATTASGSRPKRISLCTVGEAPDRVHAVVARSKRLGLRAPYSSTGPRSALATNDTTGSMI